MFRETSECLAVFGHWSVMKRSATEEKYRTFIFLTMIIVPWSLSDWLMPTQMRCSFLAVNFLYSCEIIGSSCLTCCLLLITALHGMQTRSNDENSVCQSVCLSVCQRMHQGSHAPGKSWIFWGTISRSWKVLENAFSVLESPGNLSARSW